MQIRYPEYAAVSRLQDAARTNQPVLIPGALEPRTLPRPGITEATAARAPHAAADDGHLERTAAERADGGAPKDPVTLLDKLARTGLRGTEAIIRLLATPPRTALARAVSRAGGR
jgi:hypothetical protein